MQILVDKGQDFVETFTGIAEEFANLKSREAQTQRGQTGNGEQVIVDVGGSASTGEGPEGEKTVVNDVDGFGFEAKMRFATRQGQLLGVCNGLLRGIAGMSRLVGTGVVDKCGIGVTPGGKAAVLAAGIGIAGATFFVLLTGGADRVESRLGFDGYSGGGSATGSTGSRWTH